MSSIPENRPAEIVLQDIASYLSESGKNRRHPEDLIQGVAAEAETFKGQVVNLEIRTPFETELIDMGPTVFHEFKFVNGVWVANLSLHPENIPCPVSVDSVQFKDYQ